MILPTSRNNNTENMPHSLQEVMKVRIAWLCSRSICIAFSLKVVNPKNIKANPNTNSPNDLRPLFFEKVKGRAIANSGKMILDMLNWKPKIDMIQAVTVVPILAPIITEMACAKVRSPAFTKLTVITVVAVEDCTAAVINAPVSNPVNRLVVMAPRIFRK